jgi:hypothetical protein
VGTSQRGRGGDSERGAALLIALLFLTVGSLLALALASSAGNNLLNSSNLAVQRNIEYAADGALTGAVQASRYHSAAPCVNFAPTAALANGMYVYVQCNGTPMTVITPGVNPLPLLAPATAGAEFVPQDSGMLVSGGCIPGGPQVVTYVSPTRLSIPGPATCNSSSPATLGGYQTRTVLFWACVSSSPLSSCSATSAVATAIVTYSDTDNNGNPHTGYNAQVQSWVVNTADG